VALGDLGQVLPGVHRFLGGAWDKHFAGTLLYLDETGSGG